MVFGNEVAKSRDVRTIAAFETEATDSIFRLAPSYPLTPEMTREVRGKARDARGGVGCHGQRNLSRLLGDRLTSRDESVCLKSVKFCAMIVDQLRCRYINYKRR